MFFFIFSTDERKLSQSLPDDKLNEKNAISKIEYVQLVYI